MRNHLHPQVKRKVSHFILGEEGKVGSQSAFTTAAFIGATSLAGILLGTPQADADVKNCGGKATCPPGGWCCGCWAAGYCAVGNYNCQDMPDNRPGISCWQVW